MHTLRAVKAQQEDLQTRPVLVHELAKCDVFLLTKTL